MDDWSRRLARYRSIGGTSPLVRRAEVLGEDFFSQLWSWTLAPALGGFVRWVLKRAEAEGVGRLYFLARDGWLPWRLASQLCRAWNLPLECRYLYGSRFAWQQPLFHRDHRAAVALLCRNGLLVTLDRVLARGGLSSEERKELGDSLRLPLDQPLSRSQLGPLSEQLLASKLFVRLLDRRSRWALPGLEGYLAQEGLGEETPWALVDSGWMGNIQEALGTALEFMGRSEPVRGYYWGLYRAPRRGLWACYGFSPGRELRAQARFQPCLFEGVFTAPHGTTQGYAGRGGRMAPLLGESPPPGEFLEQAAAFMERYGVLLAREGTPSWEELERERGAVCLLLGLLMTRPTQEEAALLGSLPFSDEGTESGAARLAAPLSREEWKAVRLWNRLRSRRPGTGSFWPEGSAVLYGPHPDRLLRELDWVRWQRVLRLAGKAWKSQRRPRGKEDV